MWRSKAMLRAMDRLYANVPEGQQNAGGNNGNQQQNNGQQQSGQNNNNGNLTLGADFWDNTPSPGGQQQQQTTQPQGGNQQQGQQQTTQPPAAQQISDYVKGLKPLRDIDFTTMQQKFANGDFAGIQDMMMQFATNMYQNFMVDTNRLMTNQIASAIEKATSTSRSEYQTNMLNQQLAEALPFTADPLVRPIAQKVFQQALDKKLPVDKAIQAVGQYFQHTVKAAGKHFGGSNASHRQQQTGFGGTPPIGSDGGSDEELPDWMQVLGQSGG